MCNILNLLATCPYNYELINHPHPIRTVTDGMKHFQIEAGQTAPTLILNADDSIYAMIISGSQKRLDFHAIASVLGCNHVTLAKPKEVEIVTGFIIGNIPMIGHSIPCILDNRLLNYSFVYGGTGNPLVTLKISPQALSQLNNVVAYFTSEYVSQLKPIAPSAPNK
jgi:prolyl-tRNA editing enzyme YbaK/EbsC (Cys-tRNA(Pro) deacylase)